MWRRRRTRRKNCTLHRREIGGDTADRVQSKVENSAVSVLNDYREEPLIYQRRGKGDTSFYGEDSELRLTSFIVDFV